MTVNENASQTQRRPQFALIADDVSLGEGVILNEFINLYGCQIGDGSMIGTFVEIQSGVVIGKRCRIQSHSFLCSGVSLGDRVFIGHGVMFVNDLYPRVKAAEASTWQQKNVIVENDVSIGSGAVILGGITIGSNAMIGAGAVVTRNVEPNAVVYGVPARNAATQSS